MLTTLLVFLLINLCRYNMPQYIEDEEEEAEETDKNQIALHSKALGVVRTVPPFVGFLPLPPFSSPPPLSLIPVVTYFLILKMSTC